MTAPRRDPLPAYCFKVEFSLRAGSADAFFKSISGIRVETEAVPIKEGGVNHTTRQLPGATKWSNLTFARGFSGSSELLTWQKRWLGAGPKDRISGTIIQLDTQLKPRRRWRFTGGMPVKWELSDFDASKSEFSIETLVIAHDGIEDV